MARDPLIAVGAVAVADVVGEGCGRTPFIGLGHPGGPDPLPEMGPTVVRVLSPTMMGERRSDVKMRRYTPEQIVRKLREADTMLAEGSELREVAKTLEVSEANYHRSRALASEVRGRPRPARFGPMAKRAAE